MSSSRPLGPRSSRRCSRSLRPLRSRAAPGCARSTVDAGAGVEPLRVRTTAHRCSRLDQIIYNELRLRLGPQSGCAGRCEGHRHGLEQRPRAHQDQRRQARRPQYEMIVTATITRRRRRRRRFSSAAQRSRQRRLYDVVAPGARRHRSAQTDAAERAAQAARRHRPARPSSPRSRPTAAHDRAQGARGRPLPRPSRYLEGIFLAYGPDAGLVRETAQRLARRFAGDPAMLVVARRRRDRRGSRPARRRGQDHLAVRRQARHPRPQRRQGRGAAAERAQGRSRRRRDRPRSRQPRRRAIRCARWSRPQSSAAPCPATPTATRRCSA